MSRPGPSALATYAAPMAASRPHAPATAGRTTRRAPRRRRQRSVRVTFSVALLVLATGLVLASLPTGSALWTGLASVAALVLAWASLRVMWTEVLQSRQENARDRAAAAYAYQQLFATRAAEHAEFTSTMTERLARAHLSQRELEGRVARQQQRVDELEQAALARQAQEAEALSTWESDSRDSVVELAAWDEKVRDTMRAAAGRSRRQQA